MSPIKTIIFDLDGTLIDSSKSILAGFAGAFAEEGLNPVLPLTAEIIGPPLKETLAALAASEDEKLIDRLAERFKHHYDTEGYKATTVFDGVATMLDALSGARLPLHIATNKRLLPTQRILEHLDWTKHFTQTYALDRWRPPARDKADMIDRALNDLRLVREETLYVGDRREDGNAATANRMPFALAEWGYGVVNENFPGQWIRLSHPEQLFSLAITKHL